MSSKEEMETLLDSLRSKLGLFPPPLNSSKSGSEDSREVSITFSDSDLNSFSYSHADEETGDDIREETEEELARRQAQRRRQQLQGVKPTRIRSAQHGQRRSLQMTRKNTEQAVFEISDVEDNKCHFGMSPILVALVRLYCMQIV